MCELGNLADDGLVLQTIAAAVGVSEQPGRPLQSTLADYLRNRRLCLILDNCEHVLAACAGHAYDLLRAASGLRILATSREALGIAGERVFPVPSLELPRLDGPISAEEAARWPAVRLFVERAASVEPSFSLTDQNAVSVVQVLSLIHI